MFPFAGTTEPMSDDPVEQILARTWRPTLSYVGADGFPPTGRAGNVLRPSTALALSMRLPPTCDPQAALAAFERPLTADPPSGATVTFTHKEAAPGWNAPPFAPWLRAALDDASTAAFGQPARTIGEGGTIPFMGMLGAMFPAAQFVITGVLVPGQQRPRSQRVPPPPDRPPGHRVRRPPARRPRRLPLPNAMSERCRQPNRFHGVGIVVGDDLVVTAGHTVEGDLRELTVDGEHAAVTIDRRTDLALLSADMPTVDSPTGTGDPTRAIDRHVTLVVEHATDQATYRRDVVIFTPGVADGETGGFRCRSPRGE